VSPGDDGIEAVGLDPEQSAVRAELRAREDGGRPSHHSSHPARDLIVLDCLSLLALALLGVALAWLIA
jgi:hypothetical protein